VKPSGRKPSTRRVGRRDSPPSRAFRKYPGVYFASVILQAQDSNSRLVSSEGTAIASPSANNTLIMEAQTRADDAWI